MHRRMRRRIVLGGAGLPLGLVATKAFIANTLNAPYAQFMSRSPHFARGAISSLKIAVGNWYIQETSTGKETGTGGTATFTASVEYPSGTFTQIKFGGSPSIVAADLTTAFSDFVSVSIPHGALFWIRLYGVYSVTGVFVSFPAGTSIDSGNGAACTNAASGVADQTMGGTVATTFPNVGWSPVAIFGRTAAKSMFLMGDSRQRGQTDTAPVNAEHNMGEIAPSLAAYGYINAGIGGTTINGWLTGNARQLELLNMCPNMIVVSEMGINDITALRVGSTIIADHQTAQALIKKPMYLTTLPPISTSTDAWATTVNQTTHATNAARNTYNGLVRAVPAWAAGYFEVANVNETSQGSGIWKAPGFTTDGVHETSSANEAIRVSGNVHYP